MSNLLEYAFGLDPKLPDANGQPHGGIVLIEGTPYFALTFRRLILGNELNYVVESSGDLVKWFPLAGRSTSAELNSDGTQTVTMRELVPLTSQAHRFLRLRVTRQ